MGHYVCAGLLLSSPAPGQGACLACAFQTEREDIDFLIGARAAPYRNAQIDLSGWRTDLIGPFKSPGFSGAGKTESPSRFTLSQTSASGQDAPGDAGQFVGRGDRQHVVMRAASGQSRSTT
jgi:hypothetical protein